MDLINRQLIYFVCIFSLFLSNNQSNGDEVVDFLRTAVTSVDKEMFQFVLKSRGDPNETIQNLLKKLQKIFTTINTHWPYDLSFGLEEVKAIYKDENFYNSLHRISTLYEFLNKDVQNPERERGQNTQRAFVEFTKDVLAHPKRNLIQAVNFVEAAIKKDIYQSVKKEMVNKLCYSDLSTSQVLYFLHTSINISLLKAFLVMQVAGAIARTYKVTPKGSPQKTRKKYFEMSQRNADLIYEIGQNSSREIWKCDPKTFQEGQSYEQLTGLLQGYVVNEINLNIKKQCNNKCEQYETTTSSTCNPGYVCEEQRMCVGSILKCENLAPNLRICLSSLESFRRYDFIMPSNTQRKTYGNPNSCSGITKFIKAPKTQCTYCLCYCDEAGMFSDRFFSLQPVLADIYKDRVVIGIRFVKEDRVIHLQIKEGKIKPYGKIDESTVRWVPVNRIDITDRLEERVSNTVYHTLTPSSRAIDLDDVEAEEGYIVTGVQFKLVNNHLKLAIYTTAYNYEDGQLTDVKRSNWKINGVNRDESEERIRETRGIKQRLKRQIGESNPTLFENLDPVMTIPQHTDLDEWGMHLKKEKRSPQRGGQRPQRRQQKPPMNNEYSYEYSSEESYEYQPLPNEKPRRLPPNGNEEEDDDDDDDYYDEDNTEEGGGEEIITRKPFLKIPVDPNNPYLNLSKTTVPTDSQTPSEPDSMSGMYIEFTHTDTGKDAAQTTIPYIDIQPVEMGISQPLSGIGIYHKGSNGFGGFIAPKIITKDFITFISKNLGEMKE